ncbi:MAG: BACON domain-containing protein [Bacteroidaceae bacterium]|nr:BACON domain-containing protein [Bacteroidaceae bacterium]
MKRFFLYAIAFMALSAGFVSCAEDKVEEEASLAASVEKLDVNGLVQTHAVTLTAPGVYSVATPDWIVVSDPSEARAVNATSTIRFTISTNDTGAERIGEIVITSAGLTLNIPVTQAASPAGKYVYTVASALDPSYSYTDTLYVEWAGTKATAFNIGNIDPALSEAGFKYGNGQNYVTAEYSEENGLLYFAPGADIHISDVTYADQLYIQESYVIPFKRGNAIADIFQMEDINSVIDNGYLVVGDAEYQSLIMLGAFFTQLIAPETQNGVVMFDAYDGMITYTRVTK